MNMSANELEKYLKSEAKWRKSRDAYWRMENSWLALAGLFWLQEGDNRIGSASTNEIVLPETAPNLLGIVVKQGSKLRLVISAEHTITVDDEPTLEADLRPDMKGTPSVIKYGDLTMIIIQRGDDYALRLWDNSRSERETFAGRIWYPIDINYRIPARYERFTAPTQLSVPTTIGTQLLVTASGKVHFELKGQAYSLIVSESVVHGLSISFRDTTNGKTTYGACRYLMTELPDNDDNVMLDFNRAYNPPCSITDFATCAFPPPENHLPIAIEVGERIL